MAYDKQEAIALREQGLSYREIAQQTGYSIDWCKQHLKGVSKNKEEKDLLMEAVHLAQSNTGITTGDIIRLVQIMYPYNNTKEQEDAQRRGILRFKSYIKKQPNTLIRPYWMKPENANLSFQSILSIVDNVSIHMNEEIIAIRKQFDYDTSYDKSIRFAVIKMLYCSGLLKEGVENHCAMLEEVVVELEKRNL